MKQVLIIIAAIVVIVAIIIGVLVMSTNHSSSSSNSNPNSNPNPNSTKSSAGPQTMADGLQITDQTVGTGTVVKPGDTVTVTYTGTLADGTVFDSTDKHGGTPATFPLSNVIQGWQEGIPGMKVGGTRTLVIPGPLAYGANPPPGIPANATLTFQIKLLAVK
jgi:FKBP-type peptidyl-prolyl cis-trans isomerase